MFIETRASAKRGDLGEKLSRPGGAYFNGSSILNWGLHESYHICKRGRHWLGSGLYYGRPWIACSSPLPSDCLSSLCLIKTNEAKWQASERDCRSKCHLKKVSFFFLKNHFLDSSSHTTEPITVWSSSRKSFCKIFAERLSCMNCKGSGLVQLSLPHICLPQTTSCCLRSSNPYVSDVVSRIDTLLP